jgi:hypothetical protein
MRLDSQRDLYSGLGIGGRGMGDRNHRYQRPAGHDLTRHDDNTGPIFATFFPTAAMLARPKIGVANDEAWMRIWKRHEVAL